MSRATFVGGFVVLLFCLTLPVFAADGFGGSATGGAGGPIVTVDNNATDFKNYVEPNDSPCIVQVSGTIDLYSAGGVVEIRSNKTIRGVDPNAKIIGRVRFRDDANNVIIERLTITNPYMGSAYDGISVRDRVTNVFITHCTVYDCGDGCIDITNESDYVTVSWCKFYYNDPTPDESHRFVNLVGGDYPAPLDVGKFHVTFHHNWWGARCRERMPSVRYGRAHIYNNYYNCTGNNYCIRSRVLAECLIENNYFDHVDEPYVIHAGEPPLGKIFASGNILIECTTGWDDGDDDVFDPPYSYIIDSGADINTIVQNGAGVGKIGGDITPPATPVGLTATTGYTTVALDWNDNNESDLAGYNVYRSTTSPGGYSKLNGSLLSDSNYVDNITTHNTNYYYIVTAVDTNSNESGYPSTVFSGLYGDFTGNGIVEMNDLPDFLDFWPVDDCDETYWLDLNGDCIVNFYEFALLAQNWSGN